MENKEVIFIKSLKNEFNKITIRKGTKGILKEEHKNNFIDIELKNKNIVPLVPISYLKEVV